MNKLLNILNSMSYLDIVKNFTMGVVILLLADCAAGILIYAILPPEIPVLIEKVYNREADLNMLKRALQNREIDGLRFKAEEKVA